MGNFGQESLSEFIWPNKGKMTKEWNKYGHIRVQYGLGQNTMSFIRDKGKVNFVDFAT